MALQEKVKTHYKSSRRSDKIATLLPYLLLSRLSQLLQPAVKRFNVKAIQTVPKLSKAVQKINARKLKLQGSNSDRAKGTAQVNSEESNHDDTVVYATVQKPNRINTQSASTIPPREDSDSSDEEHSQGMTSVELHTYQMISTYDVIDEAAKPNDRSQTHCNQADGNQVTRIEEGIYDEVPDAPRTLSSNVPA